MQYSTIILSAGKIDHTLLSSGTNISQGMIPVNGKPVVSWIIDDLIHKNIKEITVVVNFNDIKLIHFLERVYSQRISLTIASVRETRSILDSLVCGLRKSNTSQNIRIILGDTLIKDSFENKSDIVYLGRVNETKRWCLVKSDSNGYITEYRDKADSTTDSNLALAGYYELTDKSYLLKCALDSIKSKNFELSDALKKYQIKYPIKGLVTNEWYDFGHIDNLVNARRQLLQPRHFNKLTINPLLNTITKVSSHNSKLKDELNWYISIPDPLKVLTPRLINYTENDNKITIVQEYYGYPTLAELYVYGEIQTDTWISILNQVLKIQNEFSKYTGDLDPSNIRTMYMDKTETRLNELSSQSKFWKQLLGLNEINLNGYVLKNIPLLMNDISNYIDRMIKTSSINIIHGDLCFSNILFDVTHQIIRLIDPRGSFGVKGIYGDPMYDIAKLRHSVNGLYDFITSNMFNVKIIKEDTFKSEIYFDDALSEVQTAFDNLIIKNGIDLNQIMLIEGLLFVSLVPLHKDDFDRQLMLYLTGIHTLNKAIEANIS